MAKYLRLTLTVLFQTVQGQSWSEKFSSIINNFGKARQAISIPRPASIYIYDIPDELLHAGQVKNFTTCPLEFYDSELLIPEIARFRLPKVTHEDGGSADYYLVPQYSTCHYHQCRVANGQSKSQCQAEVSAYMQAILDYIQVNHEFWDRNQGMDHLFIFSWDHGAQFFKPFLWNHLASSIHLTQTGTKQPTKGFNPAKDIAIPVLRDFTQIVSSPKDRFGLQRERSIFAYFRGTLGKDEEGYGGSRKVRSVIARLGEEDPHHFFVKEGHSPFYWNELERARFALCPLGWAPWSARLFDAIVAGAIPVIISDNLLGPFENVLLDYHEFTIRVPEAEVENIGQILSSLDPAEENKLRTNLGKVYQHFVYSMNPFKGMDAFESIYEILVRRLKLTVETNNATTDEEDENDLLKDYILDLGQVKDFETIKVEL